MNRFVSYLLFSFLAVMLAMGAAPVAAEEGGLPHGVYRIQPAQPITGSKPEVVEVFNFKCSHCYDLHHTLAGWVAGNRNRFDIRMMPIHWGTQSDLPARAYFAAEYMGKGAEMMAAIYKAHFDLHLNIEDPNELAALAEEMGLNKEAFKAQMSSFGVGAKSDQSMAMQKNYGVKSTPSIVVNGQYRVEPVNDTTWKEMLEQVERLTAR